MTAPAACMRLRLMWALHFYGHPNVKMLDGGYQKWVARRTRNEPGHVREPMNPSRFTAREPDRWMFADINDVLAAIGVEGLDVAGRSHRWRVGRLQ